MNLLRWLFPTPQVLGKNQAVKLMLEKSRKETHVGAGKMERIRTSGAHVTDAR